MGRRKIEIKAIKDDRNRSVTFLKRKGGLFKKAHELSVLCSVDVAVFVFGNNKKLYEYSSADMRELITKYQYHGGPSESKGPSDFNGGNDDDDDDEGDGSPPQGHDPMEAQMMPPQYHGQQPSFPQLRHTPSVSPPMPNGHFQNQHHYPQRGHTPQPPVGSRPGSRNDGRRMGPNMVNQQGAHPGITYMPTPPIYNPAQTQSNLMPQQGHQYPYPHPQQQQQPQPPQPPQHQPQAYMDDRQPVGPGYTSQPPPQPITITRTHPSPPQPGHLPQPMPHISTPPQPERRATDPQPPPPVEPKTEQAERPQRPLLNTDVGITKLPARKGHSIFTPIEDNNGSILSQHLASFASEPQHKVEPGTVAAAVGRSHSTDLNKTNRAGSSTHSSPPAPQRSDTHSSIPETMFTPPSRSNTGGAGARPRGPRLTVQIPAGGEEPSSAGGDSNSPRNPSDATSHTVQRQNSVVLPPPSPSASTLLSAGATGPPNPFARPPPQQNVNGDTPASALPSRFLGNEFLPSPSSFYNDWNFRGGDNNTLPSPLNFATPLAGSGPSFLRDDPTASTGAQGNSLTATSNALGKRKSPDLGDHDQHHDDAMEGATESVKRVKVN